MMRINSGFLHDIKKALLNNKFSGAVAIMTGYLILNVIAYYSNFEILNRNPREAIDVIGILLIVWLGLKVVEHISKIIEMITEGKSILSLMLKKHILGDNILKNASESDIQAATDDLNKQMGSMITKIDQNSNAKKEANLTATIADLKK